MVVVWVREAGSAERPFRLEVYFFNWDDFVPLLEEEDHMRVLDGENVFQLFAEAVALALDLRVVFVHFIVVRLTSAVTNKNELVLVVP